MNSLSWSNGISRLFGSFCRMISPTGRVAVPDQLSVFISIVDFSYRVSKWNRAARSSNPREIDAENQHGDRERRRKQRLRTGLRELDNLIAIDRAARALEGGAASCDDGNSNHHHCQSGIAGRDRDERAGVFRGKMGYASATDRIDKDVQLDEKKSKCRHGQAGAYPGKKGSLVRRVVGVVRDHCIAPRARNIELGSQI